MKVKIKKLFILVLLFNLFVCGITFVKESIITVFASNDSSSYVSNVDLSAYRKNYISDDNVGYTSTTDVSLPFTPLTSLSVKTSEKNIKLVKDNKIGVPVLLLSKASDFSIYLKGKDISKSRELGNGYYLSSDSYGNTQTGDKTPNLKANGSDKVFVGKIDTGALVVQTSFDGKNYTQKNLEHFSNGFYTTDYLSNFGNQNKKIYMPDGNSIKKGLYVSINFYYEAYTIERWTEKKYSDAELAATWILNWPLAIWMTSNNEDIPKSKNIYKNFRESYTLYVIEDNPEVVTFNNLTTQDTTEIKQYPKPSSDNIDEYEKQYEQYNNYITTVVDRISNTMLDGDMSTKGFRINVSNNPYLNVSVKRNGKIYTLPPLRTLSNEGNQKVYEIKDSGKYEVTIKSYSKQKQITLYIDKSDLNTAYINYFGEEVIYNNQIYGDYFLNYSPNNPYGNERVFDSLSNIPVFKSPLTLNLKELNDASIVPLYGTIINQSTGEKLEIKSNQIKLEDFGEYELLFYTNKSYYDSIILEQNNVSISGDVRTFSFKFKLVGKDNHKTINETLLSSSQFQDLTISTPSDYCPMFYGVARVTANKGRVIVAFANKEDALKYAKDVVWGEFETHIDSNGNKYFKIPNINNPYGAKIDSYNGFENARVLKALSEQMVETHFFDTTKMSSYLTISKSAEEIESEGIELSDLQFESLYKSVIIWYNEEQRTQALAQSQEIDGFEVVKLIGKQNVATLSKDDKGIYSIVNEFTSDYKFVKDALGLDSYTLEAMDTNFKTFNLNYEEGLYEQFVKANLESGLVQITEKNIYGETVGKYYVYFIKEGYQPANITLSSNEKQFVISSNTDSKDNQFNNLKIEDITNCVDQYSIIKVTHLVNGVTSISYYLANEAKGLEFTDSGTYQLTIIDRFSNNYNYNFTIK